MQSISQRVRGLSDELSASTDSDVVHLRTLRKAIGFLGVALPFALLGGENLRDRFLSGSGAMGRVLVDGSISDYYHTGMREVFVAILSALGIFLLCYKGPQMWDVLAAKLAGAFALIVALFPTPDFSREKSDTGILAPDSLTLFSGSGAADPTFVGYVHYAAAAVFFITVALISVFLFTKSGAGEPTPRKLLRNRIYRFCGITILLAIALISVDKFLLGGRWSLGTSFVFWMETVAVTAFGIAWLTKAEVLFADKQPARRPAG